MPRVWSGGSAASTCCSRSAGSCPGHIFASAAPAQTQAARLLSTLLERQAKRSNPIQCSVAFTVERRGAVLVMWCEIRCTVNVEHLRLSCKHRSRQMGSSVGWTRAMTGGLSSSSGQLRQAMSEQAMSDHQHGQVCVGCAPMAHDSFSAGVSISSRSRTQCVKKV